MKLSTAGQDLVDDLHDLKVTSLEAGATPPEILAAELYHLAHTIVAYADDDDHQQDLVTFVLETLPGLVVQRREAARWRLTLDLDHE